MLCEIDFISKNHKRTKRNYLARVTDPIYPKYKAAELAKKFDFDYWDGDRRICYGGYKYIAGYWEETVKEITKYYDLSDDAKILDIGCGKGFLLYEFSKLLPNAKLKGIDISNYAIKNSKKEIRSSLEVGNATSLPYPDNYFDLVLSINCLHCLHVYDLEKSLIEMERVGKKDKYLCVESFRSEIEKQNLLYWQVTCEAFHNPKSWKWWFNKTGYSGDYSFIYFE